MTSTAQPTPYSCPVCAGSENCYLICNRPDCPDGRDRGHPHRPLHYPAAERAPRGMRVWSIVAALIALTALALCWGKF